MNTTQQSFRDIRNAAQRAARANQHFADVLTKVLDSEQLTELDGYSFATTTGDATKEPTSGAPRSTPPPPNDRRQPAPEKEPVDEVLVSERRSDSSATAAAAKSEEKPPQSAPAQSPAQLQAQSQSNPYGSPVASSAPGPAQPSTQPPAPHAPHSGHAEPPRQSFMERLMASEELKDNKLVRWWQREETVTKILAILGGVITIIGLVFLAMLAYRSGILGPRSSVILAAVICVIVFASAFKARKNNPDGVLGPALIVVATLGALADIWVAVFRLEWYSPTLGAVITSLLVIVGLLVAYTWNHEKLGIIITAFSPLFILPVAINVLNATYYTPAFAGCILATALAAFAIRWGNQWSGLHLTASIVFLIGVLLTWERPVLTLLAGAAGVALLMIFSYEQPVVSRGLEVLAWLAFLLVPTFISIDSRPYHYIFTGAVFTAMLAWVVANGGYARYDFTQRRQAQENASTGFYVACAALALSMTREYLDGGSAIFGFVFMALAIGLVWALPRVEPKAAVIAIIGGLLMALQDTVMAWAGVGRGPRGAMELESVIFIALGAAIAVGMLVKRKQLGEPDDLAELALFVIALFQISAIVPAVFLLVSQTEISYMVAQLVISVAWMFIGIRLINHKGEAYRKAGLTLTLLATAKLVFFDLSVLGGLVQVIAFIVSGVILLVAAFNREKILKDDNQEN